MKAKNILPLDISAHHNSKIEWWYFHGYFTSSDSELFYFMLSIFSNKLEYVENSQSGYSCIIELRDNNSNKNYIISQVDRSFYNEFLNLKNKNQDFNINHKIFETLIEEYKTSGPPEPITVSDSVVQIHEKPFSLVWDSISISQDNNKFLLSFSVSKQNKTTCFFELVPETNNFQIPIQFKDGSISSGMKYVFSPKLYLSGTANGEKVTGNAWMDHQWGDLSWFMHGKKRKSVLGWEWLGINFDDGTNLLVMVHRNAATKEILSQYACFIDANGKSQIVKSFDIIPVRKWESPKTFIEYPIEIKIVIPELDAELRFNPLGDDQEIPFFGPMRAIWQGAGHIVGTIKNLCVKGLARYELNGYGYIFDFYSYMNQLGEKVDHIIEGFFPKTVVEEDINRFAGSPMWKYEPEAYNQVLTKPIWDLISRKGKRWRPIFTRLLLGALGVDPKPYDELLFAVSELNHTGSLIIDDIQDKSLTRRGDQSIHLRYGSDLAINAANTIYFLPTLLLFDHPKLDQEQKVEIYELMTRGFIKGHLGQGLDLYWSKNISHKNLNLWLQDSTESKLLQMYAFKTAAGLQALAETAVIIAKSNQKLKEACNEFTQAFGVAFQIVDDIHNFSDSEDWRKTCGEDLKEGKLTYVIHNAMVESDENKRKLLVDLLCSPELRKNEDMLAEGVKIIKKSGTLEKSREFAKNMIEPQWEKLSGLLPSTDQKIILRILCSHLLSLNFTS